MKEIKSALCAVLSIAIFTSCVTKQLDTSEIKQYEYTFRELPEAVYIEAADGFAGGSGIEGDPYQISNAAELALLAELTNNNEKDYLVAYYKLTDDIVLNDISNVSGWNSNAPKYSWLPISVSNFFTGDFDGNNHTISGIYLNADNSDKGGYSAYGLFGRNNGTIHNLSLESGYICISGYSTDVGAICGANEQEGIVADCTNNAAISFYDAKCGGISGNNLGIIETCTNNGGILGLKDSSNSIAGGIAGYSTGKIHDCVNNASIKSDDNSIWELGGVVGSLSDGSVLNCVNNADINGTYYAAGIAASVSATNIGRTELHTVSVVNCENNGTISNRQTAGGIAAFVSGNGSNTVKISDCKNKGGIAAIGKETGPNAAGIVAEVARKIECDIEHCENAGAVQSSNSAAGIIAQIVPDGTVLNITDTINSGQITSTGFYAGGILSYLNPLSEEGAIKLDNCENQGNIESHAEVGGIIALAGNSAMFTKEADDYLSVLNCKNSGDLYSHSANCYVGGIVGAFGLKNFRSEIKGCTNTGNIAFEDFILTEEDKNAQDGFKLIRIAGGIVGKVGDAIYLSADEKDDANDNINSNNPVLSISNCSNIGKITGNEVEEQYSYIFENRFGGIIGQASGKEGYSFSAENCTYSFPEQGLGSDSMADVGIKN